MLVKLEEDENGDLILPLNEEVCKSMDLHTGDTIIWEPLDNGSVRFYKKENDAG